ncbi:MAG: hypothetical protein HQK92_02325 [Nitrospirae bacterium]|nr:hypothetical protein [Nitrospirota bacterium]
MTAVFCKVVTKLIKTPDNNVFNAFTGCLYAKKTRVLIWFLFLLLLAFLFLMPPVPFAVSIGGVSALLFTVAQVLPLYRTNAGGNHEIIIYFPTICTIFLVTLLKQKDRIIYWVYILTLAFVIAYFPFLRQEVQGTAVLMFLAIACFSYLLVFLSFSYKEGIYNKMFVSIAKRISVIIVITICMTFFITNVFKVYTSYKSGKSFFDVNAPSHGSFHALYISLGFVTNPYFITATDFAGRLQIKYMRNAGEDDIYEAGFKADNANNKYQNIIKKIYISTVIESPDLLLKNILVKLSLFNNYMLGKNDNTYSQVDTLGKFNNKYLVWMYKLFLVVFPIILFLIFFVYRSEHLVLLTTGFTAMVVSVLIVRILTLPNYLSNANGVLISTFFVLIPAIFVYSKEKYHNFYCSNDKEFFSKIYKVIKLLIIALIALCFIVTFWTFYRQHVNNTNAKKLLQGNPLPAIQKMQHRYAYLFNRLSSAEKLQIIAKLKTLEGNGVVGRIIATSGNTAVFNVIAAMYSEKEIHIVGDYCKSQVITNDFKYGHIDSLNITKNEKIGRYVDNFGGDQCLNGITDEKRDECINIDVNSGFFNNEYVMVSLPVTENFKKNKRLYVRLLHPEEVQDLYGKHDDYNPVTTVTVDFNPAP